jgi:hypothetical protein
MRIWGSISYFAANLFGGVILSWTGYEAVPVLISMGLAAFFLATLLVPRLGGQGAPHSRASGHWQRPSIGVSFMR